MREWILTSSVLILAVLALRWLLKGRISLRLQYALWAVVLVRLLVPLQFFTSQMSVAEAAQTIDLTQPVRQVYTAVRQPELTQQYNIIFAQVQSDYTAQEKTVDDTVIHRETQQQLQQQIDLDVSALLRMIWLAGMGVSALVLVGCNLHFTARLRRSRRLLEDVCCLLPVYESGAVPTPCLFGLFDVAIYLPPEAARSKEIHQYVLNHEMTHYRHLDHIWALLRSVCLVVHWYNPLVWLAYKCSREDAELACDEGTLERLGEEHRAEYGRTLIALTCGRRLGAGLVAATTMTGSAKTLAQRLKLLMKRPKTTVLTLIAVLVAGSLAVGCTFSGAPGTTAPEASDPTESAGGADATDPTGHTPDPDMSNKDSDIPIPDFTEPGSNPLLTGGILTYPGTQWNMTPDEVKASLGLAEGECETYVDVVKAANYAIYGFEAKGHDFFGIPVTLRFEFRAFTREQWLGLTNVQVLFDTNDGIRQCNDMVINDFGFPADSQTSGIYSMTWESDAMLSDYADAAYWPIYQAEQDRDDDAVSRLMLYGNGTGQEDHLQFVSNLPHLMQLEAYWRQESSNPDPSEPVVEFASVEYFQALLNPQLYRSEADWYPLALTSFYDDPTQIDLFQLFYGGIPGADNTLSESEERYLKAVPGYFPELDVVRIPAAEIDRVLTQYFGITLDETAGIGLENFIYIEGQDCYYHYHSDSNLSFWVVTAIAQAEEDVWHVWYESNPDYGAQAPGVITLRLVDDRWQILSNVSTEGMLTPAQIAQVNEAFEPLIIAEGSDAVEINPVTCFFSSYYDDVRELDLEAFLRYCPLAQAATEEEFQLLKQEQSFAHRNCETMADMPVPLHRYRAEDIDALLQKYAGISHDDLENANKSDISLDYLPETDCYYNDTSDAGFETFVCIGGIIYDDHVMLYSERATLILREVDGKYYIQAHQIIK